MVMYPLPHEVIIPVYGGRSMSNNANLKRKKIKATKQFRQLMEQHFKEADSAAKDENQKVAWCTSVGPAELLTAFGFKLYFPENHAASRHDGHRRSRDRLHRQIGDKILRLRPPPYLLYVGARHAGAA